MVSKADVIRWGGSSSIFPWSPKADDSVGGGGNSRIVQWSQKAGAIQWGGGVVPWIFRLWTTFTFLGFPTKGFPGGPNIAQE